MWRYPIENSLLKMIDLKRVCVLLFWTNFIFFQLLSQFLYRPLYPLQCIHVYSEEAHLHHWCTVSKNWCMNRGKCLNCWGTHAPGLRKYGMRFANRVLFSGVFMLLASKIIAICKLTAKIWKSLHMPIVNIGNWLKHFTLSVIRLYFYCTRRWGGYNCI